MDPRDVEAYVLDHGLTGEVLRLPEHTPTVETAARVVGCAVDQIVKSVLFLAETTPDHLEPVLVITAGTDRIDYRRVARLLGITRRRLRLAGPGEVLEHTGYPVGGVAPLAHPRPLRTLLDRRVLDQPLVYGGGGAVDALLRIAPRELARASQAEIVDVVREDAVPAQSPESNPDPEA